MNKHTTFEIVAFVSAMLKPSAGLSCIRMSYV